jgi:hypothetical protein
MGSPGILAAIMALSGNLRKAKRYGSGRLCKTTEELIEVF